MPGRVAECPCGDGARGIQRCSDAGRFDPCVCDDEAAAATAQLEGVWTGALTGHFHPASSSTQVRLDLDTQPDGTLSGTLAFGDMDAEIQPLPTAPGVGYWPTGDVPMAGPLALEPSLRAEGPVDGFRYTLQNVKRTGTRLAFEVVRAEPWASWCRMQTPVALAHDRFDCYRSDRGGQFGYPDRCAVILETGRQSVDCDLMTLCGDADICDCAADGCFENDQNRVRFEVELSGGVMRTVSHSDWGFTVMAGEAFEGAVSPQQAAEARAAWMENAAAHAPVCEGIEFRTLAWPANRPVPNTLRNGTNMIMADEVETLTGLEIDASAAFVMPGALGGGHTTTEAGEYCRPPDAEQGSVTVFATRSDGCHPTNFDDHPPLARWSAPRLVVADGAWPGPLETTSHPRHRVDAWVGGCQRGTGEPCGLQDACSPPGVCAGITHRPEGVCVSAHDHYLEVEDRTTTPIAHGERVAMTQYVGLDGVVADVFVEVTANHSSPEELSFALRAPSGKTIDLDGASSDATFQWTVLGLEGSPALGDWTLFVTDQEKGNTGSIDLWTLGVVAGP